MEPPYFSEVRCGHAAARALRSSNQLLMIKMREIIKSQRENKSTNQQTNKPETVLMILLLTTYLILNVF